MKNRTQAIKKAVTQIIFNSQRHATNPTSRCAYYLT